MKYNQSHYGPKNIDSSINSIAEKHNLNITKEIREKLVHLIIGCREGLYKWQNIYKNCIVPLIKLNPDNYREVMVKYESLGRIISKEKQILLYGEVEGNIRWEHYVKSQATKNGFEHKNKKYGMSREEFDAYNKSRSVTLENCISRHGTKKGTEIFESYREKQRYVGCSLEYFVDVYGEEDGTLRYKNLNKQKKITLENMVSKYGTEDGAKRYDAWAKIAKAGSKSKPAMQFFGKIHKIIGDSFGSLIYVSETTNEEFYILTDSGRLYCYDFVIPELKICVEFNGDIFHANPKLYAENDFIKYPPPGKFAKQIWEEDHIKLEELKKKGYSVYVVWESEYKGDPDKQILNCVDFIKGHQ